MKVMDAITEILKREGISTMFCFPTTPIIESAAAAGIRPIICRQERVGVHMYRSLRDDLVVARGIAMGTITEKIH